MYQVELITSKEKIEKAIEQLLSSIACHQATTLSNSPQQFLINLKKPHNERPLCAVIVKKNNIIICIAPCFLTKSIFQLSLGLLKFFKFKHTQLKLFGSELLYADNCDENECVKMLFNFLQEKKIADSFYVETVAESSALATFLLGDNGWTNSHASENNIIRQLILPETHEEYLSAMKRKVRYNIKRTVKQFEDTYNENYKLIEYSSSNNVKDLLDKVDFLYSKSWQSNIKGSFKRNTSQAIENRQEQAQQGWLRCFILECSNKPIAFVLGTQHEGVYDYEETGYDPEFSSHSPGNVLTYKLIEKLFNHNPPKLVDFGYGENVYKKVFGNHSYTAFNILASHKTSKLHLLIQTQKVLNKAYSQIKSILTRLNIDAYVRKLLKRK